jgi:hypothetical protein
MEPLKKETGAKKEGPRRLVGPEERSLATTSRGTMYAVFGLLLVVTLGVGYWVYATLFAGGSGSAPPGRPTRKQSEGVRKMKPPRPPAGKETVVWPAIAPEDRPLVAQAAQANLTAAILRGIPGVTRSGGPGAISYQLSAISHQLSGS